MSRLPGELDGRRFLRVLDRFGWHVIRQKGSHRVLSHETRGGLLVVAFHRTIDRKAMRRTLHQAGIDDDAFLDEL